ncbi:type II toxin-antitoxin system VapC family toxin [Larkinella sp. VNQ87]|uniref:type II toxin-antitoxin system VapC family toxin n=1 Tax=Larkinella sp. VNQ87 TaxID=3400921 RepID=UPI003BFE2C41
MEPAIFDTSVWVDFMNGTENRQVQLLENTIRQQPGFVLLTPTILQEILQGLRSEGDFRRTQAILSGFPLLAPDWQTLSVEAARLYFELRKKGITIRKSTDCLIAQVALRADVLLVHNDTDFDQISRHTSLRTLR